MVFKPVIMNNVKEWPIRLLESSTSSPKSPKTKPKAHQKTFRSAIKQSVKSYKYYLDFVEMWRGYAADVNEKAMISNPYIIFMFVMRIPSILCHAAWCPYPDEMFCSIILLVKQTQTWLTEWHDFLFFYTYTIHISFPCVSFSVVYRVDYLRIFNP